MEVEDMVKTKSESFDDGSRRRVTGWRRYVKRWRWRKIKGFVWLRHQATGVSFRLGRKVKEKDMVEVVFCTCIPGRLNKHCLIDVIDDTRSKVRQPQAQAENHPIDS